MRGGEDGEGEDVRRQGIHLCAQGKAERTGGDPWWQTSPYWRRTERSLHRYNTSIATEPVDAVCLAGAFRAKPELLTISSTLDQHVGLANSTSQRHSCKRF
ncbi:uncharacterized protein KZ484_022717 isoform 1-T1 [Pholidichthys leucotaenia]